MTINLTPELLVAAVGSSRELSKRYAEVLSLGCSRFLIDTPERLAAFLAQVGHESGGFRYCREVWGPTPAQSRYEGREDLGNTEPGDGATYLGRGLIQLTGRYNYREMTQLLRKAGFADAPNFEVHPAELESPKWAALSACAFWDSRGCNRFADNGDFETLTRRINGGLNGFQDRVVRWRKAEAALRAAATPTLSPVPPAVPRPTPAPPAPVAPEPENATLKEKPMAPLIPVLAATLLDIFTPLAREKISKEMNRHTDKPEVAEKIADGIISAAKTVTKIEDPIQAVAEVRKDPELAKAVETLSLERLDGLLTLVEKMSKTDEASVAAARGFSQSEDWMINFKWLKMKFIHILSLGFVAYSGWFVQDIWLSLTSEMRSSVIVLMIIGGYIGVRDFWMGSSDGSQKKTAELIRRSKD